MTISKQILISFLIILACMLLIAWMGLNSITKIRSSYERAISPSARVMLLGSRLNQDLLEHMLVNHKLIFATSSEQARYIFAMKRLRLSIQERYLLINELVDDEGQDLLSDFKQVWDAYGEKTSSDELDVSNSDYQQLISKVAAAQSELEAGQAAIKKLVDKNEQDMQDIEKVFNNEYEAKKNRYLMISTVAIIISVLLSFLISRRFSNSIELVKQYARTLSQGDYSHTLPMRGSDEVVEIVNALNKIPMAQSFKMEHLKNRINHIESSAHVLCQNIPLESQENYKVSKADMLTLRDEIASLKNAFEDYFKT